MENKDFKKVSIKYRTCYYFNDIIKFEDFDFDTILLDEKLYKNIVLRHFLQYTDWCKTIAN